MDTDFNVSELGKKGIQILVYLLDNINKPVKKTDLLDVVASSTTVDDYVTLLEKYGLIEVIENKFGKKVINIRLTKRGEDVSYQLKHIGKTYVMPPEGSLNFDNMQALVHMNVYDDHIAVEEYNYDHKGHNRTVFVYVKLNGNGVLRLWCEVDQTFHCRHTDFAWTLPDVQAMVQYQIRNGNAKGVD